LDSIKSGFTQIIYPRSYSKTPQQQQAHQVFHQTQRIWILQSLNTLDSTVLIHDVLLVEGLKHNLLSISQLYDKGYQVIFKTNSCEIRLPNSKKVFLIGKMVNNVYLLDISNSASIGCPLTKHEESWLWHRRIAHIHMHHLNKLISKELVVGLPKLKFEKDHM